MKKFTILGTLLIALPFMVLGAASARADSRHDHDHGHQHAHPPAWGHGDIHHFYHNDIGIWHGGHWVHGHYGSRFGWWWVVAGVWYFYPQPVYPYPDPYIPPVVVTQAAPATPPAASGPAPTQYWYYCKSSKTYYPYVASCPEGWEQVPSTPPPPSASDTPPG